MLSPVMAEDSHQRTEATDGSHYQLLLLSPPLATMESVEELLDVELSMQDNPVPIKLDQISDPCLVAACFGHSGKAVMLCDAHAVVIKDYASRHKAIFSIDMVPLDDEKYRLARIIVLGIRFPIWVFIPDDTAHSYDWLEPSISFDTMGTGQEMRPRQRKSYIITARAGSDSTLHKKRLRPAQDILNRLRYDSEHNEDDYKVVYEDRFLGEVSLNLSQWVSDTTDEEFIPQHRIVRFDRKWDSFTVWDRHERIDTLFYSAANGAQRKPGLAYEILTAAKLMEFEDSLVASHRGQMRKVMLEFEDRPGERVKGLAYGR